MKTAAPFLLVALVVVQAGVFIANSSGTVDETLYLQMAQSALEQHDNAEFAARGVAPLPVLLAFALPVGNHVNDYVPAILLARASAVTLFTVPLILVVYFWMGSLFNAWAGFTAAALVALSPTIVAHGSLATTDACFVLFALVTLWALARYLEMPTWGRLAMLVVAGGFVFAAKYSGIILSGIAGVTLAWMDRPDRSWLRRSATACAIAAAMIAAGVVLTFQYHPLAGLLSQLHHQSAGHEAFLFGKRRTTGWWYYQVAALATKSTLVELVTFIVASAVFVKAFRTRSIDVRIWAMTCAVVLALSMTSRVSIGVRYVLLLYPLAIMAAVAWGTGVARTRPAMAVMAGLLALAAQATEAVATAPRYLSYFNVLAGGPMNGYRLLADSNLDWGQDLPAMRQVLTSVGAREPIAAYFGSAPPDAYGVNAWPWNIAGPDVKMRADWLIISATYLDGLDVPNDQFRPFRQVTPTARPTPSLFVYDTSRPEVKAAIVQAMDRNR